MKRYISMLILFCITVLSLSGCRNEPSVQQPENRNSIQMIIAETLPGCPAFENNCFYARDAQGEFYRVYWEELANLREHDVVTVSYIGDITEIKYLDYQTGYTPKYEISAAEVKSAQNIKYEGDAYNITLPLSEKSLKVVKEYEQYIPYVTDELILKAEEAIQKEISGYSADPHYYLKADKEGYLCLTYEAIVPVDGIDHQHKMYAERISAKGIENKEGPILKIPVRGIQSIHISTLPFSDSYERVYTHAQKILDVTDYLNGLTLTEDFPENPDLCAGMTWVIEIINLDGSKNTVYHFGNMFIRVDSGRWYKMLYEEAENFSSVISSLPSDKAGGEAAVLNGEGSQTRYLSGNNSITALSRLTFSQEYKPDGERGFTGALADYPGIMGILPKPDELAQLHIPELMLEGKVSAQPAVNCEINAVYLIDMNDRTGYPRTCTSFEKLSKLPPGRYYVLTEVTAEKSCFPDVPKNRYGYEELFCLVIDSSQRSNLQIEWIIDRAEKENIPTDTALELFYSDGRSDYYFPTIRSEYVIVAFADGTRKTVKEAVNSGMMAIADLDRFGIKYCKKDREPEQDAVFRLKRYSWDGYGVSSKAIKQGPLANAMINALSGLKETGEITEKLSDEIVDECTGALPIERGTLWIEGMDGVIYRLSPDLEQICRVQTHLGRGKVLEMTDELSDLLWDAWQYYPNDCYSGTYKNGKIDLKHVYEADSIIRSVQIDSINISNEISSVNQISLLFAANQSINVTATLESFQSNDNRGSWTVKDVRLIKGEQTRINMEFTGFGNISYQVVIRADNTKILLNILP